MPKSIKRTASKPKTKKLWSRKKDAMLWVLPIFILLLFFNSAVIIGRFQQTIDREAVVMPQARSNFAIMQFKWNDNLPANDKMIKLAKDFKVVGVSTQVLNLGKVSLWLAPSVESYVIDAAGDRYGMVFATEITKPLNAGEYAPQHAATGELTYAIPKNSKNPKWCYELSQSNGGGAPICIPLNSYSESAN